VTRLRCGGIFSIDFVTNLMLMSRSESVLKIGQYLVNLWSIKSTVALFCLTLANVPPRVGPGL